jgi:hypothetical protein
MANIGGPSIVASSRPSFAARIGALLRDLACGPIRFIGILAGWKAESSQEVATHLLLLIGFSIEWVVLQRVVVEQAMKDARLDGPNLVPALDFATSIVILCLLFHQFVIFRNFSLPRNAEDRRRQLSLDRKVDQSVHFLQAGNVSATLEILKHLQDPSGVREPKEVKRLRLLKFFEIMIFAFFGVLTGEAGYMLTVLREHDGAHWTSRALLDAFGTSGWAWGRTLECTFLLCATIVCLLVLLWDGIVALSPTTKARYGGSLWTFVKNDFLSLLFWLSLFVLNTPSARFWLGERFTGGLGGNIPNVWGFLGATSLLYVVLIGKRVWAGFKALASEPSYLDARFTAL